MLRRTEKRFEIIRQRIRFIWFVARHRKNIRKFNFHGSSFCIPKQKVHHNCMSGDQRRNVLSLQLHFKQIHFIGSQIYNRSSQNLSSHFQRHVGQSIRSTKMENFENHCLQNHFSIGTNIRIYCWNHHSRRKI